MGDTSTDIQFEFDIEIATAALLLMARLGVPKFDQYKACKLLFLSDKRHLVKYGRTITGDRYAALEHGPIPSNSRDELKRLIDQDSGSLRDAFEVDRNFQYPRLVAKKSFDESVLSKSDVQVIQEIVSEFGAKSFGELRAITHETIAYKNAWKPSSTEKSFPMKFAEFFEEDEDAFSGVLEEVTENSFIRTAFA